MTITSIAPLRVAGLIEFHVFDTEPLRLLTYCILPGWVKHPRPRTINKQNQTLGIKSSEVTVEGTSGGVLKQSEGKRRMRSKNQEIGGIAAKRPHVTFS
jgi:hypothetical protein